MTRNRCPLPRAFDYDPFERSSPVALIAHNLAQCAVAFL
jgi:hypothetical protein